ncbi:MAG: twin-arginine translocase subunit TatC [Deltaproteobacteria bacterium]|nr:twin-arginine translocase subunit TatC [Deltaproteobacteria bacterium]
MSTTTPDAATGEAPDAEPLGAPMTFREHLQDLRKRLVRIVLILLVGVFVAWEFRVELFEFLSRPVADALADNGIYHFQAIHLTESIVVYLKVALVGALFLTSPFIFFQLWGFVAPGLYKREKRFIIPLTAFSVVFFLIGAAFAYTVIIPFITNWLVQLTLSSGQVDVVVTLQNAYAFSFLFLGMFGLVFELPLVLFFMALWGLVTAKGLLKFWRYFVVISFIVCGILTPPDPLSQTLMAVPVNVLYGFGVIVAMTVGRARARDANNVSGRALRAMALTLLAVVAVTIGFFLFITGLPRPPLAAWGPPDAVAVVGLNPRILAAEKAVLGVVRQHEDAARTLDALAAAGVSLEDITEGAVTVAASGARAVMLRGDGLGALAPEIVKSLDGMTSVRALDDDTLAFGPDALLTTLAPRDRGGRSDDDRRLVSRLETSGPIWLLVDRAEVAGPLRAALVGAESAADLEAFGAALALGQGTGARRQLTFDLPVAKERSGPVEARIEAARVAALARAGETKNELVMRALTTLAGELERLAPPADKARIGALVGELAALAPAPLPDTFPALIALAPSLRGVSVRRDEHRITVTSELEDGGIDLLFGWIAGRAQPTSAR